MTPSKSFQLNKEDYKRILRTIITIYSPVILLFLDQIQKGVFDYKILYVLAVSVSIDVIRRYLKNYTK